MSTGVERTEAQSQGENEWQAGDEIPRSALEPIRATGLENDLPQTPRTGTRLLAAFLVLASLLWLGVGGYAITRAWPGESLVAWVSWAATLSAPLILFALLWLMFGRSSRIEAARFTDAVSAMRRESQALEAVLSIVGGRLQDHRSLLSQEAERLMALGDEASDRLGRVTHFLSRESAELDRKAQALDSAAGSARVDIGVLMSDLPRAEEQARAVADAMRAAGLIAHEQLGGLDTQLTSLIARGREADDIAGGAAQRLAAHISRIDSSTGAAAERMDQTAAQMNAAVDGAMGRISDSIDQARSGFETQGQAMLAMVEQSRAAFEEAGAEAARRLGERLDLLSGKIETLGGQIAAQDMASQSLAANLGQQLGELETQFSTFGASGDAQTARLGETIGGLRGLVGQLQSELEQGSTASSQLVSRTQEVAGGLSDALSALEGQALRTRETVEQVVPSMESIQAAAALAAESMTESESSLQRQREALDGQLAAIRGNIAEAEERLRALGAGLGEADGAAIRMVQETGPQLIEALVRVREAANQAANHAREAIVGVIPDSIAALADASREAVEQAVTEPVQDQLAEIAGASQRAMAVARQASERLTRQLLTMSETAQAIEDRITEDQARREEKDADALSRRVSLLIEALNSTAIDVNKLLSNEVADSAWAAYLKGDRGVFTRRAVRLLESGEAREIQRHYADEPDFRDQVNRYLHDFETMMRRVLADREGSALAVTLLSSDMGKLYVALSQAVERLRR